MRFVRGMDEVRELHHRHACMKRDPLPRKRDPLQRKTRPTSARTHLITHKTALCMCKRDLLMYAKEAYWYTGNRQAHRQPRHIHRRTHKTYWRNGGPGSVLHMMLNSAMSIFCMSSSCVCTCVLVCVCVCVCACARARLSGAQKRGNPRKNEKRAARIPRVCKGWREGGGKGVQEIGV